MRRPNINWLPSMSDEVRWSSIQYKKTRTMRARIPLLLSSKIHVDGRRVLSFYFFFFVDKKQLVYDKRETAIKLHRANLERRRHKRRNETERGVHNDIFFKQLKIVKWGEENATAAAGKRGRAKKIQSIKLTPEYIYTYTNGKTRRSVRLGQLKLYIVKV